MSEHVSELLTDPLLPESLRGMTIVDLLAAVPYLHTATYEAMLEGVPIKLTARLDDPTYRKRRLLADRLGKWESGRGEQSEKRAHSQGSSLRGGRTRKDYLRRTERIA